MENLIKKLRKFAEERDWEQFHSPKNLSMALAVEAAELMENFQWLTEEQSRNLDAKTLEKVKEEINRPTFAKLKPPLPKICRYISYSQLKKEIDETGERIQYMKPEFIERIAESCETEEV